MDEIIKNSFATFFHHKIHDFGDMKMHKNLCQQLVPGSHDFILIFPVLKGEERKRNKMKVKRKGRMGVTLEEAIYR